MHLQFSCSFAPPAMCMLVTCLPPASQLALKSLQSRRAIPNCESQAATWYSTSKTIRHYCFAGWLPAPWLSTPPSHAIYWTVCADKVISGLSAAKESRLTGPAVDFKIDFDVGKLQLLAAALDKVDDAVKALPTPSGVSCEAAHRLCRVRPSTLRGNIVPLIVHVPSVVLALVLA